MQHVLTNFVKLMSDYKYPNTDNDTFTDLPGEMLKLLHN